MFGIWTSVNEEEHVLDYDGVRVAYLMRQSLILHSFHQQLKQCVLGCRLVPTHFPNNNSCTIDCVSKTHIRLCNRNPLRYTTHGTHGNHIFFMQEEKCNANCSNTLSCEREGSIHCVS